MKVLHVSTYDTGGAFQAALRLHKGLIDLKIQSKILVLYHENDFSEVYGFLNNRSVWQKIIDSLRSRIHIFLTEKNMNNQHTQFAHASSPYNIKKHPLFQEADIINLHWVAGFLDYHSFFKNLLKPIIWTFHDMAPFSNGFHYECTRYPGFEKLETRNKKIKVEALRNIKNLCVISPSKWLIKKSLLSDPFRNFKHYHIPNSVETSIFKYLDKKKARNALNISADYKVLLFLADNVLDKRKGLEILMKALDKPSNNTFLLIVGSSASLNLDLPNKQLGFISDAKQLATIYSSADLFVIPSIEDNLPNTVLESLACGTPVIGFKTGGIPEIIENGKNGFCADAISSDELAAEIYRGNDHIFNERKISLEAHKKFNTELQVNKYMGIYKNSIKGIN